MDLGTVGAILSFAIQQEEKAIMIYEKTMKMEREPKISAVLQFVLRNHHKMKRILQRLRRESVTEMILEPIHGLDSEAYEIRQYNSVGANSQERLSFLTNMERIRREFLEKSATKLPFLPEVRQKISMMVETTKRNLVLLGDINRIR